MPRAFAVGGLAIVLLAGVATGAISWLTRTPPASEAAPGPSGDRPAAATPPASAGPAPGAGTPAATQTATGQEPSRSPGQAPSRRHRRAGSDLAGAEPERLGAELLASWNPYAARVEGCARGKGGLGGRQVAADPAAIVRALARSGLRQDQGSLTREQETLLADLEISIDDRNGGGRPRALVLDLETLEGAVRIVGVSQARNGAVGDAVLACAQQELSGRVVAIPAARPGGRIQVALPLGPRAAGASEPAVADEAK